MCKKNEAKKQDIPRRLSETRNRVSHGDSSPGCTIPATKLLSNYDTHVSAHLEYDDERRSRSRSYERSPSPRRTPPSRGGSPDGRNHEECSPTLKSVFLCGRPADSQSPSRHSNADVRIGSDIVCDESSARILLVVLCVVETTLGEDILRFSMFLSNH
ncbi:unnamed protein product [Camellia sinensis]